MGAPSNARERLRLWAPSIAMAWALSLPAAASAQDLEPAPVLPPLERAIRIEASADTIKPGEQVVLRIHTGYEILGSFHALKTTSVSVSPAGTTTYSYLVTDSGGGADAASVTIHVSGPGAVELDTPAAEVSIPAHIFGSVDENDGAILFLGALTAEGRLAPLGLEAIQPDSSLPDPDSTTRYRLAGPPSLVSERSLSFEVGPAAVGMGPARYATLWRMLRAKDLLASTELTLAEVAERVGYGSEFSFAKAFKRTLGATPGRLRRASSAGA